MQRSHLYQRLLSGSLREHRDLALDLFGARGALLVAQWLDDELAKVDDPAYPRLFTEHVTLPGVAPQDYAHREWSAFATRFARLRARPGSVCGPRVLLDQGVHLARYRDMPAPDGRVRLAPFEDVDVEQAGHGYAMSAQRQWASSRADDGDRLLVGTIDGHNHASRATARRAGRPSVLDDVFLLLP